MNTHDLSTTETENKPAPGPPESVVFVNLHCPKNNVCYPPGNMLGTLLLHSLIRSELARRALSVRISHPNLVLNHATYTFFVEDHLAVCRCINSAMQGVSIEHGPQARSLWDYASVYYCAGEQMFRCYHAAFGTEARELTFDEIQLALQLNFPETVIELAELAKRCMGNPPPAA